ncbi:hypothetical protein GCM10010345_76060 [Streptomyces canarius]|uniref:Restriction endonuclease subunit S n=1 Tax=Streptomyces canarius TaxID=285453 RepID=A0ABQ3D5Z9_9ACTN|nr:hypothetical protein GCM10010345_76060 [Streptomyces canarius]
MSEDVIEALPHGWRRVSLGDICEIQGGGPAVRRTEQIEAGVPLIRPADPRNRRIADRSGMVCVAPPGRHVTCPSTGCSPTTSW